MSTRIHYEKNSMRKSHRIKIPLKIDIQNSIYNSYDWSMTGVSIYGQDDNFIENEFYDGVILLGLQDATISLKVKLKCTYRKNDKYGFEFLNISSKNRKVLRRYLELHLDGKLDSIDNLMAVYEEPDINSAIQEPVKLTDDEKTGLEKSFLRKSLGAILFSLLLLAGIAALLYQNLLYKYERVGMVESNYKTIYPINDGMIEKIYYKAGDKIEKNDILVDFNGDKMLHELKVLESIKNAKIKEKKMLATFKNKPNKVIDDSELLRVGRQIVNDRYKELQNANMQLKNHLITRADMRTIKKSYQDAKERYAFYKKQGVYQNSNSPQSIIPRVINVEEIELKILNQKRLLEEFRLFSPVDGTVYEVNAEVGDRVSRRDPIIILWTHAKPQIVVTLSSYKAVDLQIGSKVEIVDSVENQIFNGVVKQINDLELDNKVKMVTTKKSNEVFVTIEPEDGARVLPPHSIVKVRFKRTFGF